MLDIQQSTILIVDDVPTNIRVLVDFLENSGLKIAIAKNGESALAKSVRILPDLIILDIMMPGIDGFETCRRLKANKETSDIPVIFMSALADEVDKVKGLRLGAVDYVTKPIHNEEALARITVHLSLRHAQTLLMNEVAERRQAEIKLQEALDKLKKAQVQLIQTEKMSSLGQMVAGVAHEINNPTNFIYGNLDYARIYIQDLLEILGLYQKHYPQPVDEIQQKIDESELPFLIEDLMKLLESVEIGATRIRDIVTSLQHFSHQGKEGSKPSNLHTGLEDTITILQHRLKPGPKRRHEIQLIRNYGELPLIECYANQLNQVFMNIISNAIDAFESHSQQPNGQPLNGTASPEKLDTITISTHLEDNAWAVVRISDNGLGIPESIKDKLFDPFFTTKPVGKGTGLGLSISYQIVVNQHQGSIECLSSPNEGTTFVIKIPVKQSTAPPTKDKAKQRAQCAVEYA